MKSSYKYLRFTFVLTTIVFITFVGISLWSIKSSQEESEDLSNILEFESTVNDIYQSTLGMEAAARGYVITGNQDVFNDYENYILNINTGIEKCKSLANPKVLEILNEMEEILIEKISIANKVNRLFINDLNDVDRLNYLIKKSDEEMDRLRILRIELFKINQQEEKEIRRNVAHGNEINLILISLFGIISVVILSITYWFINQQFKTNDQLQAEKESQLQNLEEYKNLIENLNSHTSDIICILDEDERVILWNKSGEMLSQYSENEVKQKYYLEIFANSERNNVRGIVSRMKENKLQNERTESKILNKKGKTIPVEVLFSRWEKENEDIISLFIRDIRERKKQEEQVKKLLADLESSNEDLQQFAYVASHDLQEPLRKIQSFGERLNKNIHAENEKSQLYLVKMTDAAARMQKLIQDLLDFSRVSRNVGEHQEIDLNRTMKRITSDLGVLISEKNAHVFYPDNLPVINGISSQVDQLFRNLINNAIKFTEEDKKPKVQINFEIISKTEFRQLFNENPPKSKYYLISVKDNGIGFDEKYLDKIFTIFQRLHGKNEFQGTGIGLALCRKIMENHEGFITAQSKTGEGATFFLTFPVN